MRRRSRRNGDGSIRETLEELIEERPDGEETINADERLLIGNVLNLRDLSAADVMVPRAEIVAIEASAPLEELVALMTREAHSRVPVYRETLDEVLGLVHIKDVLARAGDGGSFDLGQITRKVLFVSPTIRVLDLLLQMRLARVHMALVVDEYGGVDGLVTIEDLVEEIVGDIQDEHDAEEVGMIARPDGTIIADARTELEAFEAEIGPVLSKTEREEDIDTLGGLIFTLVNRVPGRGEIIRHESGVEFEIIDADPRRIKRVRLRNLPAPPPESDRAAPAP
jgi:CBS domain containing-hemolysin-like protein